MPKTRGSEVWGEQSLQEPQAGIEGQSSCEGGSDSSGRWPRVDEGVRRWGKPAAKLPEAKGVEMCKNVGGIKLWARKGKRQRIELPAGSWWPWTGPTQDGLMLWDLVKRLQGHSCIKDPCFLGLSLCSNSCLPRSTGLSVGDRKTFCNINLSILLFNLHICRSTYNTC